MLEAVLDRLANDSTLSGLLGATEGDSRIYPHSTEGFDPAVVYNDSEVSRGGVNQSRLELRVVSQDFALTRSIMMRVIELLDVADDETGWWHNGVNVLTCRLNGGGALEFDGADVFERFAYFDVKWKETV